DVNKAENSVLSILDLVLCSLAPLEFPNRAVERRRAFRRVRLGSLVLEELCYWSSLSAGLVSYCYFARDPVSLLRLGLSEAIRLLHPVLRCSAVLPLVGYFVFRPSCG